MSEADVQEPEKQVPQAARTSIRKRLMSAYLGILAALAVGVFLLIQFTFTEREAQWQAESHDRIVSIVAQDAANGAWESVGATLDAWDSGKVTQLEVRDATGKILFERLPVDAAGVTCPVAVCTDHVINGLSYRVFEQNPGENTARAALLRRTLALGLFMLWIATWIVLLMANRISGPLKRLAEQSARLIGTVDNRPIDIPSSNDEVAALARVLEASRQRLRSQVFRDVLTGLYNRRYVLEQLESMFSGWQRSGKLAVVMVLDIDHFKSVNDTHGHDVGDLVLQAIATSLQDSVRQSDLLARFGGEEFVVVMPIDNITETQMVADRILSKVAATQVALPNGDALSVTISIGIAISDALGDSTIDPDALFNRLFALGDEALYEAKQSGRNRAVLAKKTAAPSTQAVPTEVSAV